MRTSDLPRSALVALAALLVAAPAGAQIISTALAEGDVVPGVGAVTRIDNLAVNDLGDWVVEADTDNADTNQDQVVVKDGVLWLQEGQALADPPGSSIDSFDTINLDNLGHAGWNFFLDGTGGTGDDSGIFFDTALVLQEGTISGAPEFSPGTPYIGFFETKIALDVHDRIWVMASVDDPGIASTVDRAIVLMTHDGAGNLLSESALWKEGDILPGQSEGVNDFGTGPHQWAVNNDGNVMYFADVGSSSATDGCVYLDGTLLAQEGSPSPIGGRNWELLSSRGLDVANGGATVFKANLDGDTATDEVLVRNGAIFRQEGDTLPAIAPFALTSFGTGSGPVQIDQGGHVLWYGDWDDPDTDVDTGLFLDDELIVQEGVTKIDDVFVDTISSGQDAFMLSENGRWAIFEATLANGENGAYLIDLTGPVPVTLSGLAAGIVDRTVELTWRTSTEIDHAGWRVERALRRDGPWTVLPGDAVGSGGSVRDYRFVDRAVEGDRTYWYRVVAVDVRGGETIHGPVTITTPAWSRWVTRLAGARPNPFVRTADVRFSLAEPGRVELTLHDVAGRRVRTLAVDEMPAGDHTLTWDGRDLDGHPVPAGVYFARFRTGSVEETTKIVRIGRR